MLFVPLVQIILGIQKSRIRSREHNNMIQIEQKKNYALHERNCNFYHEKVINITSILKIFDNCSAEVELANSLSPLTIITKANSNQKDENCAKFKSILLKASSEHMDLSFEGEKFETCIKNTPPSFGVETFIFGEILVEGKRIETK